MRVEDSCVVLVDNSNIWIEGMKYSAWDKGLICPGNPRQTPVDYKWRVDFGGLMETLARGRRIHAALLVGSRPPKSDEVWESARNEGFEALIFDRNAEGKEKGIDTQLAVSGTRIIHEAPYPMTLVVASGDSDFWPLVEEAKRMGWRVELRAFSSSFSKRGRLAHSVDEILPLDDDFDVIGRYVRS